MARTDAAAPWRPRVAVVIPALDEAQHIADCLESVFAQTYPAHLVEVIVADGGSRDGTREIVAALARDHPSLRLIDNPARHQAGGLNRAIAETTGEVVARLDGHAAWQPDHLVRCVGLLEETGADNVGGRVEGVGENAVGTAVALATASRFAVGGARFRYARRRCEAETVPFGCFRRSALERVGAFDESLILHEDYELNHRIRSSGGRIVLDPAIASRYWVRSSWTGLARQYFRYGRAKSAVARRAPGVVRPHHLAPPLLVLAMVPAALALRTVRGRRAVAAAATVYAAACAGAGIRAGRGAPAGARARVPLVFPTLHVCWGGGFLAGLVGRSPAAPRSAILATTPVHVPRVPVAQPAADSVALRSSSAPTASR